ncbi:hypothetical protein L6R52_04020 [Myxococcota bacterium]|nr:hypothetical protein [Myxococcota bacterium]
MRARLFPTLTLLILAPACLPEDCGGEDAVTLCGLHHASCDASVAAPSSPIEAERDAAADGGDDGDAAAADAGGTDAEAADAPGSAPSCGQMCAAACAGPGGVDQSCAQACLREHCGGG